MQSISELPIFTLSTYGHNGIDWLHSLIDGHSKIIIMPAFSFFRTIKLCKISKNQSDKEIVDKFMKIILEHKSYQVRRRKFLFNENQNKKFKNNLIEYMSKSIEKDKIKKLFYAIHYSYADIYNINLSVIKAIVIQEHVPFYLEEYVSIFNAKIIMMMRDPRASISGSIRAMSRVNMDNQLYAHDFNFIFMYWLYARRSIKKIREINLDNIFIMQNEKMHQNLTKEMEQLFKWMKLDIEECNLHQTILQKEWFGESAYLDINNENDLIKPVPENYYDIKQVEARWRNNLGEELIKMIEIMFQREMREFNYNFIYTHNIRNYLRGYYLYLSTFKKITDNYYPLYWRILQIIKLRTVRIMLLISPKYTNILFKRQ